MSQFTITTSTEQAFFQRGRKLARAADEGESLAAERILSFEDPAEMMKLISAARLALFRAVRQAPGSITDIATRLQRDRSAVKRDLDALERAGLVTIVETTLPGHGRMKQVHASATRLTLMAEVG